MEIKLSKENIREYRNQAGTMTLKRFGKDVKSFITDNVYALYHTICSQNKKLTGNSYAQDKLASGWSCYFTPKNA
jgi:hypothetical protein